MMTFKVAKRHGERVYISHDSNGREWIVYQSYGTTLWHYRREDHDISSIGYLTMADAIKAITTAEHEAHP